MFQRLWTTAAAALLTAGGLGCTSEIKRHEAEEVAPEVRFDSLQFEVYRGPALEASGTADRARMRRDTSALTAEAVRV